MQSAITSRSTGELRQLATNAKHFRWVRGIIDEPIRAIIAPEQQEVTEQALVFLNSSEQWRGEFEKLPAVFVQEKAVDKIPTLANQAVFTFSNLKPALVEVLSFFAPQFQGPLVSEHAHISRTAKIGPGTRLAPGVVVGEQVHIGANCILHANVVIEWGCQIGNRVEIHANTTIGSDGFGFATDSCGKHHKLPHVGRVVIEDDVEIGANCAIDRGTIGDTIIRRGTKMDNQCHVAHNCELGEDGLYAGAFKTAGSTKVGARFMCSGNIDLKDHITIADGVVLGARTGVTESILEPGAYIGFPAQKWKEGLRTMQNMSQVTKMRKQLQLVMKKLGMSTTEEDTP